MKSKRSEKSKQASKHTPGPWVWDEPSHWRGTAARVCSPDKQDLIAQVQISGWKPRSMAIANARLIAAAPELLEALKDCVDAVVSNGLADAMKKARATIAKATEAK